MPILSSEERIGTTIADRYELTSIAGEGGMGTVFRGVHTLSGRDVAVKLLKPELTQHEEIVRRFLSEARSAARIKHPNVVDVLDVGKEADGTAYLVLEWLDGEPLKGRLRRDGAMSPIEAVALLEPAMDALAMAHEQHKVVHRDIKPDNIFLARDPRQGIVPKVLDFGIAKVNDGDLAGQTRTGSVLGTPWYMSPEQARGKKDLSTPSDVWSFSVMLYEAVSRKRPFVAESANGAIIAIATEEPRPLKEMAPHVPDPFCAIIHSALRKKPAERPTMRAFIEQLKAAVNLSDTQAITLRANLGGIAITGSHRYEGPRPGQVGGPPSSPSLVAATPPPSMTPVPDLSATPSPSSSGVDRTAHLSEAEQPDTSQPMAVGGEVNAADTVALVPPRGNTEPGMNDPAATPLVQANVSAAPQEKKSSASFMAAAAAILILGTAGIGITASSFVLGSEGDSPVQSTATAPTETATPAEVSESGESEGTAEAPQREPDPELGVTAEENSEETAPDPNGEATADPSTEQETESEETAAEVEEPPQPEHEVRRTPRRRERTRHISENPYEPRTPSTNSSSGSTGQRQRQQPEQTNEPAGGGRRWGVGP